MVTLSGLQKLLHPPSLQYGTKTVEIIRLLLLSIVIFSSPTSHPKVQAQATQTPPLTPRLGAAHDELMINEDDLPTLLGRGSRANDFLQKGLL